MLNAKCKYLFKIQPVLLSTVLLTGLTTFDNKSVAAQTVLSCLSDDSQSFNNRAIAFYSQGRANSRRLQLGTAVRSSSEIEIINNGVIYEAGEFANVLGIIADSLINGFIQQGLNPQEANTATIVTLSQWSSLPDSSSAEVVAAVKQNLTVELGEERSELIAQIPDSLLLTNLVGLQPSTLAAIGLLPAEIESLSQIEVTSQSEGSFAEQIQGAIDTAINSLERTEAQEILSQARVNAELELNNIRDRNQTIVQPGSSLNFKFSLANQTDSAGSIKLPTAQSISENGLIGAGRVTSVTYSSAGATAQTITDTAQTVTIPSGETLDLVVRVEVGEVTPGNISQIGIDLQTGCGDSNPVQMFNILPAIGIENETEALIDPLGQITGCAGELLPDYLGFSVGMYDVDPNDPTESQPSGLTPLTITELPDDPDNEIPKGIEPNRQNSNPFFLTNQDEGRYSFLYDENTDQLDPGRNYILIVDPREDSIYDERRIKITIVSREGRIVKYTATSLDGRPISVLNSSTTIEGEIVLVEDAERLGLNLAVLDLATSICDAQEIAITKTGDRASAEPGDIVLYRLAVRNLASGAIDNIAIADTLPQGFNLMSESVMAETNSAVVAIEAVSNSDRVVNFITDATLEQGQILNLVYAAQITPDAVRGEAENSATVSAQRIDNNFVVKDGPAVHNLRLEPGIMRDSGTLIGRVFVDKNFDGEQQKGEPGIPNAVIYLENGNRVITDADGLFSVANVLPGYHTGILDLTTIPEYRLAPNLRFSENNSKSRLVNLEPGGLVRMNFGVIPTAVQEEAIDSKNEVDNSTTTNPNPPNYDK